ncbi:MAG: V-type ATP synthase subunit E [Oscillospiraceae bacterium]|nr:V-type ATP synthase subunit E [Oscillospiraceae bacterium]
MNGIENIVRRIAEDSQLEAERILAKAHEEAAQIELTCRQSAEADYAAAISKGKADADERVVRLGGVAELEAKKLVLSEKQNILDKAFAKALEELCDLPEGDYVSLLARLAADGSVTGNEELIFSPDDKAFKGQKIVDAANALLKEQGKTANLTVSEETREMKGGLYIRQGNIENNCSFETIVRLMRQSISGDVARVLFD